MLPGTRRKILRCKRLYDRLESMRKVAAKMDLSCEWVSKLLERGFYHGFYGWYLKGKAGGLPELYTKEILLAGLKECSDFGNLLKELGLSFANARRLCRYYGIEYWRIVEANQAYEKYREIAKQLQKPPAAAQG